MSWLSGIGNAIINSFDPANLLGLGTGYSGSSQGTGTGSILGDTWDKIKNGNSNEVNWQIAQQNLQYQQDRNAIEDSRYAEETAYNRAWQENERDYQRAFAEEERDYQRGLDEYQRQFAEDERNYNRALQQEIFNREDTALERQASSLSAMGINPLSQQLNGLGSGSVVSSTAPNFEGGSSSGTASAPFASTRGGQALHNDFSQIPGGILGAVSPILSIADTMNGIETAQYQRDALALQNDKQFLDNLRTANGLGIKYDGLFRTEGNTYIKMRKNNSHMDYVEPSVGSLFENADFKKNLGSTFKKDWLDSVPSWVGTIDSIANDSVYDSAAKALTKISDLFDKATTNLGNESIYDLGIKNGKFNPIQLLIKIFGLGI